MSDISDIGMGAVVMRVTEYVLRAIAVSSKHWPETKRAIPAHVKEGMALVKKP